MTKKEVVVTLGLITSFLCTAVMFFQFGVQSAREQQEELERHIQNASRSNAIMFIWNDNEASIPSEGDKVEIDFIDENNVFLKPIN